MKNLRYILLLFCIAFCLEACEKPTNDPEPEDYEDLFPFTGIDKPIISYDDMRVKLCNVWHFTYPGITTASVSRTYSVILRCKFRKATNGQIPDFAIHYVGNDKQEATLHCRDLKPGEENIKAFELKSGEPIYLGVFGKGERGSAIEVSIKAKSKDGVVIVPTLKHEDSQNKEGTVPIADYCEYIILP